MDILVVAATAMEIDPFLKRQTGTDHLITGVGVPACLYQLQKVLYSKKYDLVIQAGIAGVFTNNYVAASCVAVERDVFADIGVRENNKFINIFDMGFAGENDHPYKKGWIINNNRFLQCSPLEKVSAITVNTVTDDESINEINQQKYNATVESMEGAALHYLCAMENIPYLQLRGISNRVGDRDKSRWQIKEAILQLDAELVKHLELFNQ